MTKNRIGFPVNDEFWRVIGDGMLPVIKALKVTITKGM